MKKHSIRLLLIGTVATLLLASCKKNNGTDDTVPEGRFRATIEQGGSKGDDNSKTHLDPDWNAGSGTIKWDMHDLIKVRNTIGTTLTFQLDDGYENTSDGLFYTGEPHDNFFQPDYVAIYPAANANGAANTISSSGTTATFNLPATQTYVENSFAKGAMPMVAYSTNQTLQFKNVLGGLCFPMVGDGITLTRIVLTSNNAADKLWGVFTANCTSATPVPTYANGGSNSITLDCGSGIVLDATNATDFYVMVPPGTLEKGFTVEAYYNEYKVYEKSADWSASPVSGFIPRNTVRRVDTDLTVVVSDLTVTTISPTFITTHSAYNGGEISGGSPIECGICYALASDLTDVATDLELGKTNVTTLVATTGTSFHTEAMDGLIKDQIYYVRAYAKNEIGNIYYGEPIPFATRKDYANDYDGKLPGLFSINDNGDQVQFSSGNLQYQASTGTWRFAEYQFEWVGTNVSSQGNVYANGEHPNAALNGTKSNNNNISETYDGWIDLFGWGTSGVDGYSPRATSWYPWATSTNYKDYYAYGNYKKNLCDESGKADWGYNAISNGGNTVNSGWRTLTGGPGEDSEWGYIVNKRMASTINGVENARYCGAQITVRRGRSWTGVLFFPDDFTWPALVSHYPPLINGNLLQNIGLTEAEWSLLEQAGAVLLLSGIGYRDGSTMQITSAGCYWSSTYHSMRNATGTTISSNIYLGDIGVHRDVGYCVRLVQDAN